MSVIDLQKAREERSPHWAGPCVCLHCRHEWAGVGPMQSIGGLQCPSCDLPRGTIKHNFGPAEGDYILTCECGCDVVCAILRADGNQAVRCLACGTDMAIFR